MLTSGLWSVSLTEPCSPVSLCPAVYFASRLTSERHLGIFLQVLLQFLVIYVLPGGKRGGDGRVDPADVQFSSRGVAPGGSPGGGGDPSEQGAHASPRLDALHGEADGLTRLPTQVLLTRDC